MVECKEDIIASKATVSRLPVYLRYLRQKLREGDENISSTCIAEDLRLNPVQVRKDLALISPISGRPKLGFAVKDLIQALENFLGCNNVNDALLVGVGGLGSTLLSYEGFKNYGLNIVAAFDIREEIIGKKINNIMVFHVEKLNDIVRRLNVKMGIVTVPAAVAQSIVDYMVKSGICAIWNFAPMHLKVPENIAVKNEDLAASLAVLSRELKGAIKDSD
ncbi:MAG: redox-sensing transcriptional repressor Rex [Clostridia bacterium]|nr:redox-sensing transcriptional repressor Rex [Clostridia bacterium]